MKRTTVAVSAVLLLAAPVLAACGTESTDQPSADSDRSFTVDASDDACEVSGTEGPAGTLTFSVNNTGSKINEFYLLAEDGLRIVGEVENIGAGTNNTLTVNAPEGKYFTACKPGMKGDGIRADFTVNASDETPEVTSDDQELVDQALANYAGYVKDQSAQLLAKTQQFVKLYEAGDQDDEARALYPLARTHWERIETVAESFGDLDPKMDLREADLEPNQEWTGWHLLEKDLWPARAGKYRALTPAQRTTYAQDLLANTRKLDTRVQKLTYDVTQVANGSKGLLEEVATGKVTGEEEYWSRTDLYDFQANVDGARVGFEGLAPIVEKNDPELATQLEQRFTELQDLLDEQRVGADGFKLYDQLTQPEITALSNAVDALSEPLGRLTAAVVS